MSPEREWPMSGSLPRRNRSGFYYTSRFFRYVRRLALVGLGPVSALWHCLGARPQANMRSHSARRLDRPLSALEILEDRCVAGSGFNPGPAWLIGLDALGMESALIGLASDQPQA